MSKFDSLFNNINSTPTPNANFTRGVDKVNAFYDQMTAFCDYELPALKNKADTIPMFTKKLAAWAEFWRSFDELKKLYNQGLDK